MGGRDAGRRVLACLLTVAAAPAALAATGLVTDTAGKPITDARVCHFQTETKIEIYCVGSDSSGRFEIVDSSENQIRVSAVGYFPEMLPGSGHHAVVLERSPTLLVRLVDAATGESLERGEVLVIYPSAKQKGPFPANRAGVRVSRVLDPGQVRVVATAEGYRPSEATLLTLEPGKETETTLELQRLPAPDGKDEPRAP